MRLFLALFLLFAVCNCKLVLKTRNLGRAASSEPSLLNIEYAGSCVDFALMAETITINPVDYNQENLYNVPGSPSSPPSGCLPFFTDETGTPRDYDNLEAHYFCANVGKNRATIQIAEVFNPVIYYYQKDLYGGDLTPGTPITNVASMEVCRDTCRSTSGCVGFAYITPGGSSCNAEGNDLSARGKECWLKSSLQPLRDHPCVISGKIGDEYTVPTGGFILGFRSDRPFRPVSGKAIRRPTCVLAEKYCAATRTAVVTACRSNEINTKKDWILNKDLVYVFPSSNPSPVDCKSSTSCCSYLPDDTVGGSYLSNENAFCVKPTNNETFKLDDLKDKPKDDHKNHKNDENEKNDKDNKKNKDNKKEDDDDDEDKRDPSD